jgi:hypothetical protein
MSWIRNTDSNKHFVNTKYFELSLIQLAEKSPIGQHSNEAEKSLIGQQSNKHFVNIE